MWKYYGRNIYNLLWKCCGCNIFQIVVKLHFYQTVITNNNLLFKICCENIVNITFFFLFFFSLSPPTISASSVPQFLFFSGPSSILGSLHFRQEFWWCSYQNSFLCPLTSFFSTGSYFFSSFLTSSNKFEHCPYYK